MYQNSISDEFKRQILFEADVLIDGKLTIRKTAQIVQVSKTCVYSHMVNYLPYIDGKRYLKVREILDKNKEERCIRGGKAYQLKQRMNK